MTPRSRKLRDLAAEMAEVILLEADYHMRVSGCEYECVTCSMAVKLRQLGTTDD